jgi:hypothetical protein
MGMRTPKDIASALNNGAGTTQANGAGGVGFSGATVTGGTPGIAPQSQSGAGTINGTGVDRLQAAGSFSSCAIAGLTGAVSGSPTAQSATFKLQDSADNSTFADYVPPGLSAAPTLVLSAANAAGQVGIDLSGARQYVRVVCTVAFTGGSSPTLLVGAGLILGGAQQEPNGLG